MAWGKNGTPNTISGAATGNIDINDLTAKNFNTILYHVIGVGAGTADTEFRVSSDSGTNYSSRNSGNGGADGTFVSDTGLPQNQYKSYTEFVVTHMCNIDGEEKLFLKWTMEQGDPGAGNITYRRELVGKHATTTGQITDVEYYDHGAGTTIDIGSNLSALGTD